MLFELGGLWIATELHLWLREACALMRMNPHAASRESKATRSESWQTNPSDCAFRAVLRVAAVALTVLDRRDHPARASAIDDARLIGK